MENQSEIRTVAVTRYVTPLREGGSLPAIVEADDWGMYVLKFRGAGQGLKALIAELIVGELARSLGLPMPEIVFADFSEEISRTEPDPEIQDLMKASIGLNLAIDYLPGSITFDPIIEKIDSFLASQIVWFDAFVTNIDRTPRNTNLLMWHKKLWLIDHGAALYFHHSWNNYQEHALRPFTQIKDHVLLPFAGEIEAADSFFREKLTAEIIESSVNIIPDDWLEENSLFATTAEHKQAYIDYLMRRFEASEIFVKEAQSAGKCSFDYAIVRLVPRVEREEFMNVGVILSCPSRQFLKAKTAIDEKRLTAFAPQVEIAQISEHLKAIEKICAGGKQAGPIGALPTRARFYWLAAPRSTIIQTSPIHSGLCDEPETALEHLFKTMVQPIESE